MRMGIKLNMMMAIMTTMSDTNMHNIDEDKELEAGDDNVN